MTTRTRRTAAQIANDLEARFRVAKAKAKNVERAKQTRTAIIAGETIRGFVNSGDAEAKRVWDRMLDGLTRKQDRLAFGLEPLPESEPGHQPTANPPVAEPLEPAVARLNQALKAWENGKTENNRVEVGQAIAGFEKVTGKHWDRLPLNERVQWDLGDRPGEVLRAS